MIIFKDVSFEDDCESKSFISEYEKNCGDIYKAINENFDWEKDVREKNESLLEENSHNCYSLNIKPKIQQETLFLIEKNENKITKPTTLTNQIKRIEDKVTEISNNIKIEEIRNNPHKQLLRNKRGRKNNNCENKKKVDHDKNSLDNMMRKIKTNLMDHLVNKLNNSLKDKTYKFYKISSFISENLKKDFNIKLMERTISDIFINTKLSNTYRKKKYISLNKILIDKIYNEKVESETIKILDKKYIEIINEIKENDLQEFLNKIEAKEKGNENQKVEEYINSLEELFKNYEKWFQTKRGRAPKTTKSESKNENSSNKI